MKMQIALTNLGKYNEGELVYTWLELPFIDCELEEALEEIGIDEEYEEYFISDYEAPFHISEYDSLERINDIAEILISYTDSELDVIIKMQESLNYADWNDLVHVYENYIITFNNCRDMSDVARQWYSMTGELDKITELIPEYYIDWEQVAHGLESGSTYIQINDTTWIEVRD